MTALVERLADKVPARGVAMAYGERIEIGGRTLIPVALVGYGFGGGGDSDDNGGGGGGGTSIPVGAYVGDETGLRFEPNPIALLAVAIPFVAVVGWGLARIARALR